MPDFGLNDLVKIKKIVISLAVIFFIWLFVTCSPVLLFAAEPGKEFWVGVQTHFPQGKNRPAAQSVGMIVNSGANSLRDEIYWFMVEQKRGSYSIPNEVGGAIQSAINQGLNPLIILSYGNKLYQSGGPQSWWHGGLPTTPEAQEAFADYAKFIATTFRGRVSLYEVWNEWNIGAGLHSIPPGFKADPKAYVNLLKKTYNSLKSIDKNIVVIGGVVAGFDAGWIKNILDREALSYMDAISIHPYSYNTPQPTPESVIEKLDALQTLIKRYNRGTEFPIYLTEVGWPNHKGAFGTSLEVSADYLGRIFFLAKSKSYIKGIWWYDFQDDGSNINSAEDNFGLVTLDFVAKPAFFVLQDISDILKKSDFVERIPTQPHLWALKFRHPDGKSTLALWSSRGGRPSTVNLRFSDDTSPGLLKQETGRKMPMSETKLDPASWSVSLTISGRPWLLHGQMGRVEISED